MTRCNAFVVAFVVAGKTMIADSGPGIGKDDKHSASAPAKNGQASSTSSAPHELAARLNRASTNENSAAESL
jgi:hypothetical protein